MVHCYSSLLNIVTPSTTIEVESLYYKNDLWLNILQINIRQVVCKFGTTLGIIKITFYLLGIGIHSIFES